jgi:hypothetical protein
MLQGYLLMGGIMVAMAGGGYLYYQDTQERIATLQKNNAKLETAIETSEASIQSLQDSMAKAAELNIKLQKDLQQAEAYGDELRGKLSRLNLVQEALKDAEVLEGKMNGATAKLWRGIMEDTGGDGDISLPGWLQPIPEPGAGSESSNENREDSSTDSSETKTSPAS